MLGKSYSHICSASPIRYHRLSQSMENRKAEPNPKSDRDANTKGENNGEDSIGMEVIDAAEEAEESSRNDSGLRNSRMPFTTLSQVDADLALARTLQEQERAYMMLRMGAAGERSLANSYSLSESEEGDGEGNDLEDENYEEDAFDAQVPVAEIDPTAFDSDEAYARALQDAEARELAVQFIGLNGLREWVVEEEEDGSESAHDTWSDVDPDELSYEELIALGEAVGTESRGLTHDRIASLPCASYKAGSSYEGSYDKCVICQLDYEEDDKLAVLPCKHMYHPDCVNSWLQINKVCPICNVEVSNSEERESQDQQETT